MRKQIQLQVNEMVEDVLSNPFRNPCGHAYSVRNVTLRMLKTTSVAHLEKFTFNPREALQIANAAYLHDIGKLMIPKKILNKNGPLSQKEREVMESHTMDGAMLIFFHPNYHQRVLQKYAFEIALHHHERVDGSGYPDGLSGLSLYPWVQIVSLADVFVALTEARSYRAAYTQEEAWKMIQQGECGAFNSSILRCLDRNQDKWMESLV